QASQPHGQCRGHRLHVADKGKSGLFPSSLACLPCLRSLCRLRPRLWVVPANFSTFGTLRVENARLDLRKRRNQPDVFVVNEDGANP
ncbi:unnamed protein product, partial [Tetraodon nigroviridis]